MSFKNPSRSFVTKWAWASMLSNSLLVLTGGLVRLTGSGLGCPTWPRCTADSFTPHGALGIHGIIEFGNRLLTYVLAAIAVATLVAVWRWAESTTREKRIAVLLLIGIPLQGVVGGITVLTDLNPWVVAIHLILSLVLIATATVLIALVTPWEMSAVPPIARKLMWLVALSSSVVIYVGTVVTGSGPHAGDAAVPRNGLNPERISQLHSVNVYLFIGLTIGAFVVLKVIDHHAAKAAKFLIGVIVLQGFIGYAQYILGLPIYLVAAHLVGATLTVVATTWLLIATTAIDRKEPKPTS